MNTSSCILMALCAVALVHRFPAIAAAPSGTSVNIADFNAAHISRVPALLAEQPQQRLDLLAADVNAAPAALSADAASAAAAAHEHESPRTTRQIVVAGGYGGYGAYPGYGGYGAVVAYRKPYVGGYAVGYPFAFGASSPSVVVGGYSPYNAYPRVIYG